MSARFIWLVTLFDNLLGRGLPFLLRLLVNTRMILYLFFILLTNLGLLSSTVFVAFRYTLCI